ncbi:MAG TPA: hypothetical protein VME17_17270 [Bryobacteraceae bacterium]|nr:hypothetical protein [Bryobacteraceae bacterium]
MKNTFFAILIFGLGLAAASVNASAAKCGRACLDQTVDSYIAALVAHDPSKVELAPDLKFVENTVPMKPGEGLWKTASQGPTTFKIYVPDPVAQQVGFIGMMQEDGKPIQFALRLKLKDGKIVEAEHLVARGLRENSLKNLQTPRPVFLATVPPSERTLRAQMLKIAESYYTALVTADANNAPFADDCLRHENGMQTTGNPPSKTPGLGMTGAMGCAAQIKTHTFDYITRIEPRRVWIADPETGLVFGLSQFRQPMEKKYVKIVGVPGLEKIDMPFKPFDLPAAHVFKIYGGKIHQIEAMGFMMPYDSKTGWERASK